MKTPREIILERHRSAEEKLKAIRPEELAAIANPPPGLGVRQSAAAFIEASKTFKQLGFFERLTAKLRALPSNFWQQSVHPWRHAWAGMAAVWLGILALNYNANQPSRVVVVQTASANPQVKAILHEQKILLTQLLGPVTQTATRPTIPGPRSEQRHELFIA